jgi:hypothetical protein
MCGQLVTNENVQGMSLSMSSCLTEQPSIGNGSSAEINAFPRAASRQTTLSECEQPVGCLNDSVTSFLNESGIPLKFLTLRVSKPWQGSCALHRLNIGFLGA